MPVKLLWGAVVLVLCQPVFAADVVKRGAWKTIDYEVQGMWSIVDTGDGLAVELDEGFETKNGPDLHILLSPKSIGELSDDNASSQALVVGLLVTSDRGLFKKMKGPQTLALPPGVDLADYRTILIHCLKYSHLWAGAPLD